MQAQAIRGYRDVGTGEAQRQIRDLPPLSADQARVLDDVSKTARQAAQGEHPPCAPAAHLKGRSVARLAAEQACIRFQRKLYNLKEEDLSSAFRELAACGQALCASRGGRATLAWLGSECAENLLTTIHARQGDVAFLETRVAQAVARQAAMLLNEGNLSPKGFEALMAGFAAGMRGLRDRETAADGLPGQTRYPAANPLANPIHAGAARRGLDNLLQAINSGEDTATVAGTIHALDQAQSVRTVPDLMAWLDPVHQGSNAARKPSRQEPSHRPPSDRPVQAVTESRRLVPLMPQAPDAQFLANLKMLEELQSSAQAQDRRRLDALRQMDAMLSRPSARKEQARMATPEQEAPTRSNPSLDKAVSRTGLPLASSGPSRSPAAAQENDDLLFDSPLPPDLPGMRASPSMDLCLPRTAALQPAAFAAGRDARAARRTVPLAAAEKPGDPGYLDMLARRFLKEEAQAQGQLEASDAGQRIAEYLGTRDAHEQAAWLREFIEVVAKANARRGEPLAGIGGKEKVYQALTKPVIEGLDIAVITGVLLGGIANARHPEDWHAVEEAAYLAAKKALLPDPANDGQPAVRSLLRILEKSREGLGEGHERLADQAIDILSRHLQRVRDTESDLDAGVDEPIDDDVDFAAMAGSARGTPLSIGKQVAMELEPSPTNGAIETAALRLFFDEINQLVHDDAQRRSIFSDLAGHVSDKALVSFSAATLDFLRTGTGVAPALLPSFDAIFKSVEKRLGRTLETGYGSPEVAGLKRGIREWRQALSIEEEPAPPARIRTPGPSALEDARQQSPSPGTPPPHERNTVDDTHRATAPRWFLHPQEDSGFDPQEDQSLPVAMGTHPVEEAAAPTETETEVYDVPAAAFVDPSLEPAPAVTEEMTRTIQTTSASSSSSSASKPPLSPIEELFAEIANAQPDGYPGVVARAGEFVASHADSLKVKEVHAICTALARQFPGQSGAIHSDLPRSILRSTPPRLRAITPLSSQQDVEEAARACRRAAGWAMSLQMTSGSAFNPKMIDQFLTFAFEKDGPDPWFLTRLGYQIEAFSMAAHGGKRLTLLTDFERKRNLLPDTYRKASDDLYRPVFGKAKANTSFQSKETLIQHARDAFNAGANTARSTAHWTRILEDATGLRHRLPNRPRDKKAADSRSD